MRLQELQAQYRREQEAFQVGLVELEEMAIETAVVAEEGRPVLAEPG